MYINLRQNICFLFSETSPHFALNISSSEEVYSFYEVSNIMGQTYAVQWLPKNIQKQMNDSTIATFMSY